MAAAAAQAFAAEPRSAWYVQGCVAEDAQSLTVGMSRDWQWEKQYRYGHISGQWQARSRAGTATAGPARSWA